MMLSMEDFEEKIERLITEIKSHTFFDPTYDAVFKRIFSKDTTLIHFLNAVLHLEGDKQIEAVERRKPSIALTSKLGRKEVRFDVHAKLPNGRFVDLEMQRATHEDFLDRVELYASQLVVNPRLTLTGNARKTKRNEHPYLMPPTYSIWICNFDVAFCCAYREEFGVFRLSDIGKTGALPIYDKKKYLFVDLTKYTPSEENSPEALWMKLFTQMASAMEAPATHDKVIDDVYARMRINILPETRITEIAAGMIAEEEIMTRLGTARREGRKEGLEEGLEKGVKKGRKEGRMEGCRETAKSLLNLIRKNSQIGKASEEFAKKLENSLLEILAAQK